MGDFNRRMVGRDAVEPQRASWVAKGQWPLTRRGRMGAAESDAVVGAR